MKFGGGRRRTFNNMPNRSDLSIDRFGLKIEEKTRYLGNRLVYFDDIWHAMHNGPLDFSAYQKFAYLKIQDGGQTSFEPYQRLKRTVAYQQNMCDVNFSELQRQKVLKFGNKTENTNITRKLRFREDRGHTHQILRLQSIAQ